MYDSFSSRKRRRRTFNSSKEDVIPHLHRIIEALHSRIIILKDIIKKSFRVLRTDGEHPYPYSTIIKLIIIDNLKKMSHFFENSSSSDSKDVKNIDLSRRILLAFYSN
jgi:hypothetical protein